MLYTLTDEGKAYMMTTEVWYRFMMPDSILEIPYREGKDYGNCKSLKNFLREIGSATLYDAYKSLYGDTKADRSYMIKKLMCHYYGTFKGSYIVFSYSSGIFEFCWFTLTADGYTKILGVHKEEIEQEYEYYSMCKMIDTLRVHTSDTGVVLDTMQWYYTGYRPEYHYMPEQMRGAKSFDKIINSRVLNGRLKLRTKLYSMLSCRVMSKDTEYHAEDVVRIYGTHSKLFSSSISEDGIILEPHAGVNFTDRLEDAPLQGKHSYAVVLDCEGTTTNGCTEIGMILYAQYEDDMVQLKEYRGTGDEVYAKLRELQSDYKGYRHKGRIPVLTYDSMDSAMIKVTLLTSGKGKKMSSIMDSMEFVDVRPFIERQAGVIGIKPSTYRLGDVAQALGVRRFPAHKALNDAKTLYNVLAGLLKVTDKTVV